MVKSTLKSSIPLPSSPTTKLLPTSITNGHHALSSNGLIINGSGGGGGHKKSREMEDFLPHHSPSIGQQPVFESLSQLQQSPSHHGQQGNNPSGGVTSLIKPISGSVLSFFRRSLSCPEDPQAAKLFSFLQILTACFGGEQSGLI